MSEGLVHFFGAPSLRMGEALFNAAAVQATTQSVVAGGLRGRIRARVRGIPCEVHWDLDSLLADCRCGASTRTGLPLCEHIWASILWCNSRGFFPPEMVARLPERLREGSWRLENITYRPAGELSLAVRSGIDWFDLEGSATFGAMRVGLPQLAAAMKAGQRNVDLGNGAVGVMPEEWIAQYGLLLTTGKPCEQGIRFTASQSLLLASSLKESPQVCWDERFAALRSGVNSFQGIAPMDAPASFEGTLRPYQREGLGWMAFLRQFHLGGCLADDMGLGKTVQVLAMLESRRTRPLEPGEVPKASLVVAPKSVIFNWAQEARRFAPGLRVVCYTGAARSRESLADADLILTTYGTLRSDVTGLCEVSFDYVILDESQAIKNASTVSAHAARQLRADHRLALSGTPIENHLRELWSLFEFLNPGLLGIASVFEAAAGQQDPQSLAALSQAMRPFLLRRTKEQVAKDLPACVQQTLYCELGQEERRIYDGLREQYRAALLSPGTAPDRMHVLEALLRLRQAACHVGLLGTCRTPPGSAKTELLLQKLLPAAQEGHKSLVFSQFTSLLALVRSELDAQQVPYAYLDGQTTDRQRVVEQFQRDADCRIFLISLKAGGVGLNLTAAEYVFLLDPWWNPAVESQAIDRAHRIGQSRRVIAYRLIAKDTVEEKVVELQRGKRKLADAIISAQASVLSDLTFADVEMLLS